MELYEFVFEKLLDVLTCPRCRDLFSNPVIMDCEHNICLNCVEDITSKESEEEQGSYRCPLCLRQGEVRDHIYNRQLGTVAAVTNTMKQVITVGYNTVRKLTGDRDSVVWSENARSKASFITRHSLGSRHPPYMTPGGALLRTFTMELYRNAFQKVVDVLTCQWCKNLFWDPVMMDCGHNICLPCAADIESKEEGGCCCPLCGYKQVQGYSSNHQLSKATVLANVMKEIISEGDSSAPRVNSDRNIRGRSDDYSSASTELPCSMERYKSVFETLMDVLTCRWCKGMFNEPVIMECGHNFCKTCSGYILSKHDKEGGCCYCPLCQAELKPEKYIYNNQLGKAAVVAKVVKDVVPWWYITVPRMTSERNSRVRSADEQSEVPFVTRHSRVSVEPPPNMDLCSSAIESLVDVLTCQRCKNQLTDPVIMNCGHSSCLSCTANESTEEGGWHCPQCQDEQSLDYFSNHQLGKAALVVTVIQKVMSGGSSTAPGVTSGQDSGVESEDAGSEASFVTSYSMPGMEPPHTMAPYKGFANRQRSLPGSVGSPNFIAGMEPPFGMVPDKIRKRTYAPYSVGLPCNVANMEPPLSMVPDKGFIKKRTLSPYSVGASYSVGSPCPIPNMEPPPSMVPDKEFIKKRTFSPYSVGTSYSVGSPCSMPNMEPPLSMVPDKEFIKERTFSPYSVESSWPIAGPEPPPNMDPRAEFEGISFPGHHEGSEY